MARTIATIQAAIAADRAARPELAGLTSPSATAIYRQIEYVVAVAHWVHETLWDRFRQAVEAFVASAPVGTPAWYADQALLFQVDEPLVVLPTGRLGYESDLPASRIIQRATAKENAQTGRLFIKVAKAGAQPGTLAALSAAEKVQVEGYYDKVGFVGVRLQIISEAADRLRVAGNIYYDPLLPVAPLKVAVVAAIEGYLAGLAFDGVVYLSKLIDAIQAVPGITDVQLATVEGRSGANQPVTITRVYETIAGYIIGEDTPGHTLPETLTFVPDGQ
ncbi:hypothetical protein GCM10023185_15650 [Hymenobacter saemangeumensis]|uniref:Baseplate J-like C-terminal domain-containing protein n=1 Tax=Hymenobacter saemangeumensis TaxID=1084522 RepID=A0ABP8I9E4_9BACT